MPVGTTKKGTVMAAKGKATKAAAPKVVRLDPELAAFREAAAKFREADEKRKLFEAEADKHKPIVKDFIGDRGEIPPKKKSREFIDEGIKWLLVPSRTIYDEKAGIAAIRRAATKAKGERKEVLAACIVTREAIDPDAYKRAKAAGFIDDETCTAYEATQVVRLDYRYVDKLRCECDAVVARNDKFCSECGAKL